MIYELRAVLFVETERYANHIYRVLKGQLSRCIVVKPGQPDQQYSFTDKLYCGHDKTPPVPCSLLKHDDNCPDQP